MSVLFDAMQEIVDVLNGAGVRTSLYQKGYTPPIALVFPSDPWLVDAEAFQQSALAITVRNYASTANLETAVEELAGTTEAIVRTLRTTFGIDTVVVEAPSQETVGTGTFLCTDINIAVWVNI